jgi:hypothetical protein
MFTILQSPFIASIVGQESVERKEDRGSEDGHHANISRSGELACHCSRRNESRMRQPAISDMLSTTRNSQPYVLLLLREEHQ